MSNGDMLVGSYSAIPDQRMENIRKLIKIMETLDERISSIQDENIKSLFIDLLVLIRSASY